MILKEYRVCMPLTTEEYRQGQQYMINRHSDEQSNAGEGVEVVRNEPHYDEDYGNGKYTEKKIHLNSRLPSWARAVTPSIYVTEKAWNYYPYTVTEYSCHFLPRLTIFIETRYEDNNGMVESEDVKFCKVKEFGLSDSDLAKREVDHIDIAYDKVPEKSYKENEDCTKFRSKKTDRGPLLPGWRETQQPIMCSYKLVLVKFEVWAFQSKVESFIQKSIRDILLVGHRQAFAWIDSWYDMTPEKLKEYEQKIQAETNSKVTGRKRSSSSKNRANDACFVDPSALIISDDMFEVYNFEAEEGILLESRKLLGTVILSGNGSELYTFDEPHFESSRNLKVRARPQHFDIVFKDISSANQSTTVKPTTTTTTTTTAATTTTEATATTTASLATPFPSPAVNSTTAVKSRPKRFYENSTGSAGDQISNFFKAYTDATFTETSIYTTAVTSNQIHADYTTDETSTADTPVRCVKAYIYQIYDLDREKQNTHYLTINTISSSFLSIPILVVINVTDINDNTPIFDQSSLSTTIRNNTAIGLIVGHIKAEDADIGQNADLRYDMQFHTERRGNANASSFLPSLLVQRTTGIVVLVRSVEDLKPPSKLTFAVVVKDNGDNRVCNRATATATISIVDVISSRTMHPSSAIPPSGTIGIAVSCSVAGVLLIAIIVLGIYRYRRNRVVIQNDGALQFMLDDGLQMIYCMLLTIARSASHRVTKKRI